MTTRLLKWTSTTAAVILIATAMGCTALMSETPTPRTTYTGKAAETGRQAEEAFERGDYQEAIKKYTEAQRHHGKPSAAAEGTIGVSYMGLGKNEAAIRHLSKAIEIEDSALLRNIRGTAYRMAGQCDRASEDARAALAMEPIKEDGSHTDVEANLILGICNSRQGQHMLALQHAESAIEISIREGYTNEETSAIRIKIGDSYEALGQNEEAVAQYSESIDLFDNPTARIRRGHLHTASKRCDQDIEDAEAALAMDPIKENGFHTDVEANFILTICHAQNGNYLPALQHAETTLEMARTHGYPETFLEEVATMSLAFQDVLEGNSGPEDMISKPTLTHLETGTDLLDQGNYEAALASFRTAQEVHGTPSGDIQAWIGHTYSAMGQSQNAIRHYTEAIGIRDNALRRIYRGDEYANNNQCTEAAADAEAALGMKADAEPGYHTDVEAHWIMALCLLDQGDGQNALFHIDKAISAARTNGYPAEDISDMSETREKVQAMG